MNHSVSDNGVSKNRCTPKSSILVGFSITNHPFWGTPIFGNTHKLPLEFGREIHVDDPRSFFWDIRVPLAFHQSRSSLANLLYLISTQGNLKGDRW